MFLVVKIVTEMGQVSPFSTNPGGVFHGLFEAKMRPMLGHAQAIQNQRVESLQPIQCSLRNEVAVGQIGEIPDTEPGHVRFSMFQGQRDDLYTGRFKSRIAELKFVEIEPRDSAALDVSRLENIIKAQLELGQSPLMTVKRDRGFLNEVETPHLIEAPDMIRMRMSHQ